MLFRSTAVAGIGARERHVGQAATQATGIADASVRQRRVAPALDAILHVELSFPMAREIEGNRHKNHWA